MQQISYTQTPSMYAMNNVRVVKLLLQRTAPMEQIYLRPFQSSLDGMVMNEITQSVQENLGVTAATIASSAGKMIRPAAQHEGVATIPYGWQQERMRWVLHVEVTDTMGNRFIEIVSGFTEYCDLSFGMHINPELRFYINQIQALNSNVNVPNTGMIREGSLVLSNNQVGQSPSEERIYLQRPQDALQAMNDATQYQAGLSFDSNTSKNIGVVPVKSTFKHNTASGYLGDLIGNYLGSKHSMEYQGAQTSVLDNTYHSVKNPVVTRDGFLSQLAHRNGITLTPNNFTLAQLCVLDPNTTNVMHVEGTSVLGFESQQWAGSDMVTQVATIIGQSVPSYLNRFGFTRMQFDMMTGCDILITDFASMSGHMDMRNMFQGFMYAVARELMPTLVGEYTFFEAKVNCDLFGITQIHLRLDGVGIFIPFSFPSFCDSLVAPVISRNPSGVQYLYESVDTVLSSVVGLGAHY